METFTYKSVGGCEIQLDVYAARSDSPAPVVVWIHGGALISGRRAIGAPGRRVLLELLREAGFAQVAIDYRLAPQTKLPAIVADVGDAIAWIRHDAPAALNLDATRLGVVGQSAGGYLALMAGFGTRPRPQALVSFYGYGDIVGDWYRRPDPFYRRRPLVSEAEAWASVHGDPVATCEPGTRAPFYLYCRQQGCWLAEVVGLDPDRGLQQFDPYRPIAHVDGAYPPTLFLHGTADTDVPYAESVRMADALDRAGVRHAWMTIPGEAHSFESDVGPGDLDVPDPSPAAAALLRAAEFLTRHVADSGSR